MSPKRLERITLESGKCGGRPCLRGYRIRVTDILSALEYAAIQVDHPILIAA